MKYELTTTFIEYNNKKLYQIKALKDFSDVKAGDLGGYIEKESNLSQEDNCWIYDEAKIYGDARIYGNARIFGNDRVYPEVYSYIQVFQNPEIFGYGVIGGKLINN